MAAPGPHPAYKTNVGRSVTRKWREASQHSYDGDDWGEDDDDDGYDEPPPRSAPVAQAPRYPGSNIHPSNRSFTNPSPARSGGRPSFDQSDERRHFSSSAGFDSAYPSTQRNPFPEIDHGDPQGHPPFQQPPLRVNTQPHGPPPFRPGSRGRPNPPYADVPLSAPGGFPQQRRDRAGSTGGPPMAPFQRQESPMRPDSRGSNTSARHFPPRKASLSLQQAPPPMSPAPVQPLEPPPAPPDDDGRPVPVFIRPSDIYKRIAEEREKERLSQDTANPVIGPVAGASKETSNVQPAAPAIPEVKESPASPQWNSGVEDTDSTRRIRTTLEPVPERKSEYGMENMLPDPVEREGSNAPAQLGIHRNPTDASSVYTDRPDPVSASTVSRNTSVREDDLPLTEAEKAARRKTFGLPAIDRMSGFGMDIGFEEFPDELSKKHSAMDPALPPPLPPKDGDAMPQKAESSLQKQPSLGYRTLVQQAFDESEIGGQFTPTSATNTINRSNSAATSDISPIIGHRQEPSLSMSDPTIPEETAQTHSRNTSTATVKPQDPASVEDTRPASQPLHQAYHREMAPPKRENSPTRRPQNAMPTTSAEPQQYSVSQDPQLYASSQDPSKDSITAEKTALGAGESLTPTLPVPERSTSDEWKEWQAQRQQFRSQAGITDSNPATPHEPSPIARSETFGKGTSLGSGADSGQPTPSDAPATSSDLESRPAPNERMESFRPVLPGGWQSFSTVGTGDQTPRQQGSDVVGKPSLLDQSRLGSTESIPTAKAPADIGSQKIAPTATAFAAVATAGAALGAAFTGQQTGGRVSAEQSEEESENEWDQSPVSSSREDIEAPGSHNSLEQDRGPVSEASDSQPPPTSDSGMAQPQSLPASTPHYGTESESDAPQSTSQFVPAPLKTNRGDPQPSGLGTSTEPTATHTSSIPTVSVSTDGSNKDDNEKLELEIVKSLTPKPSAVQGHGESSQTFTAPGESGRNLADDINFSTPKHPTNPEFFALAKVNTDVGARSQPPQEISASAAMARPYLQQRFSWETGSSQPLNSTATPQRTSPPSTNSPDTVRTTIPPASQTTASHTSAASKDNELTPSSTRPGASPDQSAHAPPVHQTLSGNVPEEPPHGQTHSEPVTFRGILNLPNSQERIRAFNESRQAHSQSDGELENWLMSLNRQDHAEVFAMNGQVSQDAAEPIPHKPSPRRMISESVGARHMQEDGKKLMAKAGKFGGKAGLAAKGLFARGKEKIRTASSGEKGFLASRRKSTQLETPEEESSRDLESEPRDTNRSSAAVDSSLQLPLNISPISGPGGADDWFKQIDTEIRNDQQGRVSGAVHQRDTDQRGLPVDHHEGPSKVPLLAPAVTAPSEEVSRSPSPAISAVESDQHHLDAAPSRSVSQITRKTADHSPIEPYQARPGKQGGSEDVPLPSQLQPPGAPVTANQTSGFLRPSPVPTDAHPGGLSVLEGRRRSVVSDVSSASPSPGAGVDGAPVLRSVSPTEEPKGVEIQQNQAEGQQPRLVIQEDPVRSQEVVHEHQSIQSIQSRQESPAKASEDAGPVAGPDPPENQDAPQPPRTEIATETQSHSDEAKPPLFVMGEGVDERYKASDDLSKVSTQPFSPVSETLSKELSQVSVDEVHEQSGENRHSRSFSRPFGADPNVRNHPAFREAEPPENSLDKDELQQSSKESPLPSARRPPEELDRVRQLKEQHEVLTIQPEPEERSGQYRIPGPYVQQYRSPKPVSAAKSSRSQTQVLASGGETLPSNRRAQPETPAYQPAEQNMSSFIPDQKRQDGYQQGQSYQDPRYQYHGYQQQPQQLQKPQNPQQFQHAQHPAQHHHQQQQQQQQQQPNYMPHPYVERQPARHFLPEGVQHPPPPVQHGYGMMPPQQHPTMAGPFATQTPTTAPAQPEKKQGGFSNLFGKSRNRLEKRVSHVEASQKEKRSSLFRHSSRHDSISSQQSSLYDRDQVGPLPTASAPAQSSRRQSKDTFRAGTPDIKEESGKKKRFSGLGSKLFKSGPKVDASKPSADAAGAHENRQPQQPHFQPPSGPAQTPYAGYGYDQSRYPNPGAPTGVQPYYEQANRPGQRMSQQYSDASNTYSSYNTFQPTQSYNPPQPGQLQPAATFHVAPDRRPADLRIDTSSGKRGPGQPQHRYSQPATAPPQSHASQMPFAPATRGHSTSHRPTTGPLNMAPGVKAASPTDRAHVLELHKRSRSPKLGRRDSEDIGPSTNTPRHTLGLGTFSGKRVSPIGVARAEGEQEKPFTIGIPGAEDEGPPVKPRVSRSEIERSPTGEANENQSKSIKGAITSGGAAGAGAAVIAAGAVGAVVATQDSGADQTTKTGGGDGALVAELPGSKAAGYESEEEIPMSATAYPGQEWVPMYSNWED